MSKVQPAMAISGLARWLPLLCHERVALFHRIV